MKQEKRKRESRAFYEMRRRAIREAVKTQTYQRVGEFWNISRQRVYQIATGK